MNYIVEEYSDAGVRLNQFDFNSNQTLFFIPENFSDEVRSSEYIYSESTSDVKKVLRAENLIIKYLTTDKPLLRTRKSADWYGPILFISYSVLSENPTIIGISLNLISSYLYDYFKGTIVETKKVKFEIVIETKKSKTLQKVKYEGSVEGIKELTEVIKSLNK
jgi:hypothetical protein